MTGMHNIDYTLGALIKMRSLLSDPNRWHRGDLRGEGPDGKASFCILGAYREVTVGDGAYGWTHRSADVDAGINWLYGLVPDTNYEKFNDYVTGHSTIMQFLDCAIDQRVRELDAKNHLIDFDPVQDELPWAIPDLSEDSLEKLLEGYNHVLSSQPIHVDPELVVAEAADDRSQHPLACV